jgi:peptidoglycan/xylan/chitin deacetylase (PgdA/CDA1 family)
MQSHVERLRAARAPHTLARIDSPHIAITFDDGPHPALTPTLLDLLARDKIRATFFCLGQAAERHPEILRRIISEGHEIGNHSWSHPDLTTLSDDAVRSELQRADLAIFQAAGVHPTLMRAPFGSLTQTQCQWICGEFRYKVILWSVDPHDWKETNPEVIARHIVRKTKPGSIILSHDIKPQTIAAMPAAIEALLAKGFKFATVSELLDLELNSRQA